MTNFQFFMSMCAGFATLTLYVIMLQGISAVASLHETADLVSRCTL